MTEFFPHFTDAEVFAKRPARNTVDPRRPYAYLVEPERNAAGEVVDVATLFLSNRECPFRCVMCDLWKNTLTESVSPGDIPEQIRRGLNQLGQAREVKLYNSGNFFDAKAIPPSDYAQIADLVRGFDTVIVENHPKLCGDACLRFRDMIYPAQLEIAIGLETCHPELLRSLNKQMTLADFDRAAEFLHAKRIRTRVFLLLNPPYLDEVAGFEWAMQSLDYAFDRGVDCCAVIPTRAGNGIMETLEADGMFRAPHGRLLERALETGIAKQRGRVFVDLWDAEQLFGCDDCRGERVARLQAMNLQQRVPPAVSCLRCDS